VPSLTRGWVYNLLVQFRFKSHRTHDHILLSHTRLPNPEGQVPVFTSRRNGWPSYTPGHWVTATAKWPCPLYLCTDRIGNTVPLLQCSFRLAMIFIPLLSPQLSSERTEQKALSLYCCLLAAAQKRPVYVIPQLLP
jgi:hypothetical protein